MFSRLMRHSFTGARRSCTSRSFLHTRPAPRRFSTASEEPVQTISAADLQFGQPLHETHPHILRAGELTPGITALEYHQRRQRLATQLPKNGIALVPAATTKYRSGSVFYPFHQDSDFFYLTGFNEPGTVAIIANTGSEDFSFHLYVPEKDERRESWEGTRSGVQAALDVFNADVSFGIEDFESSPPQVLSDASTVYTDSKPSPKGRQSVDPGKIRPLRHIMNSLRAIKSESEITNMRIAGQISGRAFTDAMAKSFSAEKTLDAFLEYRYKINGCDGSAYVPVVAGGKHALCIHYVRNDDILRDGDLVCVDSGGEYGHYITDITRSWPVNGKFTPAQRDLYEAVLDTQRYCVSLCTEASNHTLDGLHDIAARRLADSLRDLGFDMSRNAISELFPHHLGHHIGLDVHDCPGYSRNRQLQAGHCITIEPGVYVPDDDRWPAAFRKIGLRIEDSVCVDTESPFVLSTEAVKEIDDIEALRG